MPCPYLRQKPGFPLQYWFLNHEFLCHYLFTSMFDLVLKLVVGARRSRIFSLWANLADAVPLLRSKIWFLIFDE
ncbi:hypothetical protein [Microseira wollei]|uniref:hypothetical protein n=1 Tax=Microseira wollei TaxID=467598 RepID=UPI001CFD4C7D|nr:hypothetical protein [Microseira wollei]